jgi:hypothetical protein
LRRPLKLAGSRDWTPACARGSPKPPIANIASTVNATTAVPRAVHLKSLLFM